MKDFNLQDDLVAKKITKDDVSKSNVTLCITNNYLEVTFEENAWDGVANKIISSRREK